MLTRQDRQHEFDGSAGVGFLIKGFQADCSIVHFSLREIIQRQLERYWQKALKVGPAQIALLLIQAEAEPGGWSGAHEGLIVLQGTLGGGAVAFGQ